MKKTVKFRFAGIGIMIAMCAVFGIAVMLLWNALIPRIFGLPELNYLQAVGLLVLSRIFFSGMGGGLRGRYALGGAGGDERLFQHGNILRERWMNMSDDERKEFMRGRRDFSHLHEFFNGQSEDRRKDAPNGEGGKNE